MLAVNIKTILNQHKFSMFSNRIRSSVIEATAKFSLFRLVASAANLLDTKNLTLISIFMTLMAFIQLVDLDYFWHLKAGEYIFTHAALPSGDIFSYTMIGKPWILHEWLFEVVLYVLFKWMGPLGVKLLTAGLATITIVITYSLLRRMAWSPSVALTLLMATFIPFIIGVSPRPQLVTYMFFISYLYILLNYKYSKSSRNLLALPLMMLIWVNAHAGYMIGLILVGIFVVCEWRNYWNSSSRNEEERYKLIRLTQIAILTIAVSAINPWFIAHWLYPFQVMASESFQTILEWQSPNFHEWTNRIFLVLVFMFFLVTIYKERKPDLTEVLIPIVFMTLAFSSLRNIPLATLTLTPFIAKAISREQVSWMLNIWRCTRLNHLYKSWIGGGKQLGGGEVLLNWLLFFVITIGLFVWYPIYESDNNNADALIPIKAADFVSNVGISGRMFNTYHFGGYLIYRLYPSQHVFIDGRADMYGERFFNEYKKIINVGSGWKESFEKYKIDYVITEKNEPLSQLLQSHEEFRLVYDDEYNAVLVRNQPSFYKIIEKYGH